MTMTIAITFCYGFADSAWTRRILLAVVSHLELTTGPGFRLATSSGHFQAALHRRSSTACATYSAISATAGSSHSFIQFIHPFILKT